MGAKELGLVPGKCSAVSLRPESSGMGAMPLPPLFVVKEAKDPLPSNPHPTLQPHPASEGRASPLPEGRVPGER
jgi:hypothetical protein